LSEVSFSLGETARISCKHRLSTYDSVFWYKQTQDAAPSIVIHSYSKTEKKERLEMDTDKGNLSTELSISKVEMGDAGIYHCAAIQNFHHLFFSLANYGHDGHLVLSPLFPKYKGTKIVFACLFVSLLHLPTHLLCIQTDKHNLGSSLMKVILIWRLTPNSVMHDWTEFKKSARALYRQICIILTSINHGHNTALNNNEPNSDSISKVFLQNENLIIIFQYNV
ncbi:light chain variable region, partial [Podarcis lilfordi]